MVIYLFVSSLINVNTLTYNIYLDSNELNLITILLNNNNSNNDNDNNNDNNVILTLPHHPPP